MRNGKLMFIALVANHHRTCHPEWSEAESKDLRTNLTANAIQMRRFFDSLRSLRMTYLYCGAKSNSTTN